MVRPSTFRVGEGLVRSQGEARTGPGDEAKPASFRDRSGQEAARRPCHGSQDERDADAWGGRRAQRSEAAGMNEDIWMERC